MSHKRGMMESSPDKGTVFIFNNLQGRGTMFKQRREKKKIEQELWETRKMGEELYREEKERNKEHESEAAEE